MNSAKNFKDITGQKFGRLTALRRLGRDKNGYALWECKCDCGNIVSVTGNRLRTGNTKSCGCYNIDKIRERNHTLKRKHGETHTKLFHIWTGMQTRCSNPNAINYKDYGAKGISICEEWANDFTKFRDWALKNGYSPNLTIDRIDFTGNYEPGNCRWVTVKEQNRNRSSNTLITFNGETHCIAEWAEITGIEYDALIHRLQSKNFTLEEALTKPMKSHISRQNTLFRYNGEEKTIKGWAEHFGMTEYQIYCRLRYRNYDADAAFSAIRQDAG